MTAKFQILIFTLLFLFSQHKSIAQLVNVESQRIQSDSIRSAGNANLNFSYQENNNKPLIQFRTSIVYQRKTKSLKDIFLVLGSYNYSKTRDQKLSNAAFGHIRYNRTLYPLLKYELYTQIQFNQLLNLRSRYIAGTGLRFKFTNKSLFKSYLGVAAFYEYEESIELDTRVFRNDFRMSNYLVLSLRLPKDKGELTSTTYYQPLFDRFDDFRISNQTTLVLNFSKKLAFTTSFSYFFDTFPPNGIAQETISIENGLRLTF